MCGGTWRGAVHFAATGQAARRFLFAFLLLNQSRIIHLDLGDSDPPRGCQMLRHERLLPVGFWCSSSSDGGLDCHLPGWKVLVQDSSAARQHAGEGLQLHWRKLLMKIQMTIMKDSVYRTQSARKVARRQLTREAIGWSTRSRRTARSLSWKRRFC